jgi:hypothetical protein
VPASLAEWVSRDKAERAIRRNPLLTEVPCASVICCAPADRSDSKLPPKRDSRQPSLFALFGSLPSFQINLSGRSHCRGGPETEVLVLYGTCNVVSLLLGTYLS